MIIKKFPARENPPKSQNILRITSRRHHLMKRIARFATPLLLNKAYRALSYRAKYIASPPLRLDNSRNEGDVRCDAFTPRLIKLEDPWASRFSFRSSSSNSKRDVGEKPKMDN